MRLKSLAFQVLLVFFFLTLSFSLFCFRLGSAPLEDYDEATYADVALHALEGHSPWFTFARVVATEHAEEIRPWIDKPPLGIWLMMLSMKTLGANEGGARFPSAFLGFLTSIVVAVLAFVATRDKSIAFWSGLLLATNPYLLIFSREARLDTPVTFAIMAALLCWFFSLRSKKSWPVLLGWGLIALGLLWKYLVVVFVFPSMALLLFFANREERRFFLRVHHHAAGVACFFAVALPWYGFMFWTERAAFVNNLLLFHAAHFTENVIGGNGRGWTFFLQEWWARDPVLFVAVCTLAVPLSLLCWRRRASIFGGGVSHALTIPLWALSSALCVLIGFSEAKTKLSAYIMPFFPFVTLFVASSVFLLKKEARERWQRWDRFLRVAPQVLLALLALFSFGTSLRSVWSLERSGHGETLVDERAIGVLLRGTTAPIQLYLWDRAESLVFYSRRPMHFLPKTADLTVPSGSYVVTSSRLFDHKQVEGARFLYRGSVLTLLQL